MKISKLFHWLYAILMFLPFGLVVFNCLHGLFSPSAISIDFVTYESYLSSFFEDSNIFEGLSSTIREVYYYLVCDIFGLISSEYSLVYNIINLLTYWTCISIIWLVFDVFMYVPLLVHRWIDKAKLE